jgi:ABC-2 type transport system ATP-binding protein
VLSIIRLSKKFGNRIALGDVSFSVQPGEIVGLIGPNGAGKSTLLRIAAGFIAPTSGNATIGGHDVSACPLAARRLIGYLPQHAPAYPDMTGAGFLGFVARVRGLRRAQARRRIADLAERLGVLDMLDRPIGTLAPHARRRLGVAQALLPDPPLLLLDEPTEGLDPGRRQTVRDAIRVAAPGRAIVVATNLLEDVEALCGRVIVIAGGGVRADATPAELAGRSRYRNAVRLVVPAAAAPALAEELARLAAVRSIEPVSDAEGGGWWLFPWRGRPILAEIAEFARQRGLPATSLRAERGTLGDVFPALTSGGAAADATSPPVA